MHGTPAVIGLPWYHHPSPSFLCTVSNPWRLAMKLPVLTCNFMLSSLSESDLARGESTLHNDCLLAVSSKHMKEMLWFMGCRNWSCNLPNFISSFHEFCAYFPLYKHSFHYLVFSKAINSLYFTHKNIKLGNCFTTRGSLNMELAQGNTQILNASWNTKVFESEICIYSQHPSPKYLSWSSASGLQNCNALLSLPKL